MKQTTIDRVVRPIAAEAARLTIGKVPQNGSLDEFVARCAILCPAVWELKPEGCDEATREYLLVVSIVASTVAFALFFGAATHKELTDRDRQISQEFREFVRNFKRNMAGTEIIARVALRSDEAAWALAKKPR